MSPADVVCQVSAGLLEDADQEQTVGPSPDEHWLSLEGRRASYRSWSASGRHVAAAGSRVGPPLLPRKRRQASFVADAAMDLSVWPPTSRETLPRDPEFIHQRMQCIGTACLAVRAYRLTCGTPSLRRAREPSYRLHH